VKSLALLSGETFQPDLQFLRQASQLPGLFVVADEDEYRADHASVGIVSTTRRTTCACRVCSEPCPAHVIT
jgi:hypothetical protein